jgi:hypothetical protein
MAKDREAIKTVVRQFLRDELKESDEATDFQPDELDLHIDHCLPELSRVCPYEDRETVEADGTNEIDISDIEGLIGERVVEVEYPTGAIPRSTLSFSIFGNTITVDTEPTSGEDIYLYCHKVHQLTKSLSTLSPEAEKVLIDGVVAYAAMAWLNQMRSHIVPASNKWYESWANNHYLIYQKGLSDITPLKVWEF